MLWSDEIDDLHISLCCSLFIFKMRQLWESASTSLLIMVRLKA